MIDKEKYIRFQYITNFLNSEDDDDRNFIVRVLGFLENKKLDDEEHLKRIEAEMEEMWETSEICGDRLSAYMRTVAKIVELAWHKADSIVGVGRGSVGSQLNAYALGIIQTDPLKMPIEQPHWRFLSKERPDLPD